MGNDAGQAKALARSDAEEQGAQKKRPGPPPRPRSSGAIQAPQVIDTIEAVDAMSVPPSKDSEPAAARTAVDVIPANDSGTAESSRESSEKETAEAAGEGAGEASKQVNQDSQGAAEAANSEEAKPGDAEANASGADEPIPEDERALSEQPDPASDGAEASSKTASDGSAAEDESPKAKSQAAASEPESGQELVGSAEREEPLATGQDEPDEQDNRNGRQHDRFTVDLDVTVTSEHNFYAGFVENMSVGGIFIATHQLKKVGDVLEFSIHLPDDGEAIAGCGEVRWVRVYSETSNVPPGMGIRFRDLSEADQKRIEAFLAERDPMFYDDDDD